MRYFLGVLVILLGTSLLLQNTGVITDQTVKDSIGSGLIMAVGVALFVWKRKAWAWAAIIFLVGLTDLVENQQWPMFKDRTPWEFVWPVFLIIIGVHLMLRRGKDRGEVKR